MEKSLRDLLSRLPIPGLKESNDRHAIAATLSKELSIPITPKQISIRDEILSVAVPPVVKSALRVKQTQLLSTLEREGIKVKIIR